MNQKSKRLFKSPTLCTLYTIADFKHLLKMESGMGLHTLNTLGRWHRDCGLCAQPHKRNTRPAATLSWISIERLCSYFSPAAPLSGGLSHGML